MILPLFLGLGALAALAYVVGRKTAPAAPTLPRAPEKPPEPAKPGAGSGPYRAPAPALGPTTFEPAPRYLTKPSDVAAPPLWVKIGALAFAILTDRHTGGFAQLDYAGALEEAKKLGGRLATFDEIIAYSDAARAVGTEIQPPITLPDDGMLKAAGILPSNYPTKADYEKAANAFRDANMSSEAWARAHDHAVLQKLKALGWDESKPAGNAGKWWEGDAPPGRAYLKGWRRADGTWIQEGVKLAPGTLDKDKPQGRHNDRHFDYGTRTLVVRDAVA
jgi:hypothetical protein